MPTTKMLVRSTRIFKLNQSDQLNQSNKKLVYWLIGKLEILALRASLVGERSNRSEGYAVRRTGVVRSENAGMSSVWMCESSMPNAQGFRSNVRRLRVSRI